MKIYPVVLIVGLATCSVLAGKFFGQGNLTPPGAPAPTMKSLAQIEARTPISSLPFTIGASGSYYLTQNLTTASGNGIVVAADRVTLDLNGFTISSSAAAATGTGILLSGGRSNVSIRNGMIAGTVTNSGGTYSGGGFANGIYYAGGAPTAVRVTDVAVTGCLTFGINLGFNATTVKECQVTTVGSYGVLAFTAIDSTATDCGFDGFQVGIASNCYGASGNGTGVYANQAAQNCVGSSSATYGLYAITVSNCVGSTTTGDFGTTSFTAHNSYGYNAGTGAGLNAVGANNCYGQSGGGIGLTAVTANNSYGYAATDAAGISSTNALNSYGQSSTGPGVTTITASGCYGVGSDGIRAANVTTSNGTATNAFVGSGIKADTVASSFGSTPDGFSYGIFAKTVVNSRGIGAGSAGGVHGDVMGFAYGENNTATTVAALAGQIMAFSQSKHKTVGYTDIGCYVDSGEVVTNRYLEP